MEGKTAKTSASKATRKPRTTASSAQAQGTHRHLDATMNEGDFISFGPSGEKLRINKISGSEITFEKIP